MIFRNFQILINILPQKIHFWETSGIFFKVALYFDIFYLNEIIFSDYFHIKDDTFLKVSQKLKTI